MHSVSNMTAEAPSSATSLRRAPSVRGSTGKRKPLGSDERVPTQLYNGYAEFVAGLYEGRKSEKLFM